MDQKTFILRLVLSGLELIICGLVFEAAILWVTFENPELLLIDLEPGAAFGAICFWLGLQSDRSAAGLDLLQPIILSGGLTLLSVAMVSFTRVAETIPLISLILGCAGSALGVALLRSWGALKVQERVLVIGPATLSPEAVKIGGLSLIGIVDAVPSAGIAGVPYLGGYSDLEQIIAVRQPSRILVGAPNWRQCINPSWLFDQKLRFNISTETVTAYESRMLERIQPEDYKLSHLLLAETQRANRRAMAIQAVYANLAGLILLLACAPILLIFGLLSRIGAGPSPIFDRVECAGFQGIPFLHWRFRVRNVRTGRMTAVGRFLTTYGLTNMPQIFNVVRGEMGLFGPLPVRRAFSEHLDRIAPLHSYRLSVKPGIMGWAQANTGRHWRKSVHQQAFTIPEEQLRMAYDLYYLETGSPFVDLKILLRSLANINVSGSVEMRSKQ